MPQPSQGKISKDILGGITITISIFIVSIHVPLLGFFCALFLPLPVLFYRSKLGRRNGIIVPAVAIVAVLAVAGRLSFEALFFTELIILGFILAELIEMNLAVEATVGFSAGTILIIALVSLFFFGMLSHVGIYQLVSNFISRNLEFSLAVYERMGISDEKIRLITNSLHDIQTVIIRILPGLTGASILFVSWMNLLLARPLLVRKGLFFPGYGALNRWRPPETLVWGVIASGGLLLTGVQFFKLLGLNGLILLLMIYFLGGIAVVSFFFNKKNLPLLLRYFLYSLIALQQLFLLLVIALGLFDTWLNFRKINIDRISSQDP